MNQLVVEGFEWLIVPLLVVLLRLHMCFYRQLLPHVLGLDAGSSFVVFRCCLIDSMYAGGSCDSDVPFCDMYNTQLRVGPSSFLPRILLVSILLEGCTLHVAWLRGSFLRFLRCVLWFFLRMYPSH